MPQVSKLTANEIISSGGANIRVLVTHEDLTNETAAGSQTVSLFSVSSNTLVQLIGATVLTSFADADDTAFNSTAIEVGETSDADAFLSIQANANSASLKTAVAGGLGIAYPSGTAVTATVASMTAKKLSDLDSGKLLLLFKVIDLPKFRG